MRVEDLRGRTVAFAASGGLDSCTVTAWLTEHGVKVVCFTADIAQPDETDFARDRKRMRPAGPATTSPSRCTHARRERRSRSSSSRPATRALLEHDGIGRHVIVAGMVPEMRNSGIKVLCHGATGRGNDQVRFQLRTNMLAPEFRSMPRGATACSSSVSAAAPR